MKRLKNSITNAYPNFFKNLMFTLNLNTSNCLKVLFYQILYSITFSIITGSFMCFCCILTGINKINDLPFILSFIVGILITPIIFDMAVNKFKENNTND